MERSVEMKFVVENQSIKGNLGFDVLPISTNEKLGYRPYELFVSSLIGCSSTLLGNILTKKRHPFMKIELNVSSVRNPERANRIEQLAINAQVYSEKHLDLTQAEKIAHLVIENCGMIQSVIETIDITFNVITVPLKSE